MTATERAAIIGQLVAMDNVLHGIMESLQAAQEQGDTPPCEHPEHLRKYRGDTMGGDTRFTCQQCGVTVQDVQEIRERIVRSPTPAGA